MNVRTVSYDEARQFLATQTTVSSRLGVDLDHMRNGGAQPERDYLRFQAQEEARRLHQAVLIRCMDALAAKKEVKDLCWCPDLRSFARRTHMPEGEVAVRALRAYEPWDPNWPEKGLADAYAWMRTHLRRLHEAERVNGSVAQAFRTGSAPYARRCASALVADAHVVLGAWIAFYNRFLAREARRVAAA